jgi:hypothetical protein
MEIIDLLVHLCIDSTHSSSRCQKTGYMQDTNIVNGKPYAVCRLVGLLTFTSCWSRQHVHLLIALDRRLSGFILVKVLFII